MKVFLSSLVFVLFFAFPIGQSALYHHYYYPSIICFLLILNQLTSTNGEPLKNQYNVKNNAVTK